MWFKGHLIGNSEDDIMDYFFNINSDLTITLISKFVSNLKGNFAFIWKYRDYVIASVDRVNSIPIFYTDGDITIGNNTPILKESRTFEVNNNAVFINGNTGDYISGGHIQKTFINWYIEGDSYENAWKKQTP